MFLDQRIDKKSSKKSISIQGLCLLTCMLTLLSFKSFANVRTLDGGGSSSDDLIVKISSIMVNGAEATRDQSDLRQVNIHPGDSLLLLADLYDNQGEAQGDLASDFVWSQSEPALRCDVLSRCPTGSNFQVSGNGVSFIVPKDIGESVMISVLSHSESEALADFVILKNVDYSSTTPTSPAPTKPEPHLR